MPCVWPEGGVLGDTGEDGARVYPHFLFGLSSIDDCQRDRTHAVLSRMPAFLQDPFAQKEEYKDSWFDKFMVDYFAKQMSKQLGGRRQVPCRISHNITLLNGLVIPMVALRSDHSESVYAGKPYRPGYDGFVDLSKKIMKGRSSKQQQQTVAGVLGGLLPPEASARFRKWFPVSKVRLRLST